MQLQAVCGIPADVLPERPTRKLAALFVESYFENIDCGPSLDASPDLTAQYERCVRHYFGLLSKLLPACLRLHLAECLARRDRRFFIVVWETLIDRPLWEVAAVLGTDPDTVLHRAKQLRRQGLNLSER